MQLDASRELGVGVSLPVTPERLPLIRALGAAAGIDRMVMTRASDKILRDDEVPMAYRDRRPCASDEDAFLLEGVGDDSQIHFFVRGADGCASSSLSSSPETVARRMLDAHKLFLAAGASDGEIKVSYFTDDEA